MACRFWDNTRWVCFGGTGVRIVSDIKTKHVMTKQLRRLLVVGAYITGLTIGLLVHSYHILFILMSIPTGWVLWKGVKDEEKQDKEWNDLIDRIKKLSDDNR